MKTSPVSRTLLGLGLGLAFSATAQAGLTTATTDAFIRDYYAAYHAKDASRMAEFYTADATFVDPSFELDLKGPAEIRDLLAKVFVKYESLDWEITHTITAGDDLVVEGTMIGKLHGQTVRGRFTSVFHFAGGQISAQRDLFDVLHYYAQLGIVPPQFQPRPPAVVPAALKGSQPSTR